MPPATPTDTKPAVLIIGGLGYIGRFLAKYIFDNQLASEIRLVDRIIPEIASLTEEFAECCSRDRFVQADACNEQFLPKIFERDSGQEFDYVFNCGGESRFSQSPDTYRLRSYNLSQSLARACFRRKIAACVELSTGMVYSGTSPSPAKETSSIKPWTPLAEWRVKAAADFKDIEGLNLVALRLANVYGPYARGSMGTVLSLARCYQDMDDGTSMKWLWDKDLRVNTVHVEDVARAMWTAAEWKGRGAGRGMTRINDNGQSLYQVFNIVDHGDTSQGTLARLIENEFHIPTGFQGKVKSTLARINLDSMLEEENDEMLEIWADLLESSKRVPRKGAVQISPFVERELLQERHLCLDGSLFERVTGFQYSHPQLNEASIREIIESYERLGWWP